MFLYINTSKNKQFGVFLLTQNKVLNKIIKKGDYKISENLLQVIVDIFKKNHLQLNKLQGIIAVIGPGPFTSLRIAVTVANTLAFSLQIPVVGLINTDNLTDRQLIKRGLAKIKTVKTVNYLQPFYNQEPNITQPKT